MERTVAENVVDLVQAANRYVAYINKISHGKVFSQHDEAATLFTSDCKKIFNGHLQSQTRVALVNDLLSVYSTYGGWKMIPLEIIQAPMAHCAIIRLLIETERLGTNTAIVILRFDTHLAISEINEVFSPVNEGQIPKTEKVTG